MKTTHIALIWAGLIIATAIFANVMELGQATSWGLTMGLVGAAWGSVEGNRRRSCNKACG